MHSHTTVPISHKLHRTTIQGCYKSIDKSKMHNGFQAGVQDNTWWTVSGKVHWFKMGRRQRNWSIHSQGHHIPIWYSCNMVLSKTGWRFTLYKRSRVQNTNLCFYGSNVFHKFIQSELNIQTHIDNLAVRSTGLIEAISKSATNFGSRFRVWAFWLDIWSRDHIWSF